MKSATRGSGSALHKFLGWVVAATASIGFSLAMTGTASAVGKLQVQAALSELSMASPTTIITVANSGDANVSDVMVEAIGPGWADARLTESGKTPTAAARLGTLKPGKTVLLTLSATIPAGGRAGTVQLKTTAGSGLVQMTRVTLVEGSPPLTVETAGADQVGDHSSGVVTISVHNNTPGEIQVRLDATGDGLSFPVDEDQWRLPWNRADDKTSWTEDELSIDANETEHVTITIGAKPPVQPRQTALVVTAAVPSAGEPQASIVSTHEVDLSITADGLVPTITGVGSALILPGLGALLAFLWVREKDRARLNIAPRSVPAAIWDNKLWLLLALGISLITITAVKWVSGVDLIATPWTWVLLAATLVTTLLGFLASRLLVKLHRRRVPLINSDSDFKEVLGAARKTSKDRRRQVYEAGAEQVGIMIHRDYDCIVLAPQMWYSDPSSLSLAEGASIEEFLAEGDQLVGGFKAENGWIRWPTPVAGSSPKYGFTQDLLTYEPARRVGTAPPSIEDGADRAAP